jgi:hypothetical protein
MWASFPLMVGPARVVGIDLESEFAGALQPAPGHRAVIFAPNGCRA